MESFIPPLLMNFMVNNNVALINPEILILAVLITNLLLACSPLKKDQEFSWWLSLTGTGLALVSLGILFVNVYFPTLMDNQITIQQHGVMNVLQVDLFSWVIRTLLTLGTFFVLLLTRRYVEEKASDIPGEFYVVLMGALLGGMLMASAVDLVMLFVALETLGISSYILVGYLRGDLKSAEAALKYLLYGGASTAVLLFGLSLLYGVSGGNTQYAAIADQLQRQLAPFGHAMMPVVPVMLTMIMAGFAFKLSAAPFHMWTPDVYEGAPTPVTAFLSVVSKIAGFGAAIRLLYLLLTLFGQWANVLSVLAVLSMTIGNVVALKQQNVKRLLAYSTIAHVGYMLTAMVVFSLNGISSLLYYLMTYLFMNLGAFAVVIYFANLTGREDIQAFAGLVRKRPGLALMFTIFLLSLAGIPITAGFFAKFFLFQSVVEGGTNYIWLIVLGLLNSTISLYYYLNIVRLMVIAEPSDAVAALPAEPNSIQSISSLGVVMTICLLATLGLGFFANPAYDLSVQAMTQMAFKNVFQHIQVSAVPFPGGGH
ncbi:MAG: NADH-quinone oxidoreductase subunit NuoN [Cyanobacteria bacterium]|nr:NADH-quinone oxidoreductase subunit NuoN [Cyanobacteriota bacterium]